MARAEPEYQVVQCQRPFEHIGRIVHDLGGWHEFTHMVERPPAERRLPPIRQRDLTVSRWRKAVHQSNRLEGARLILTNRDYPTGGGLP